MHSQRPFMRPWDFQVSVGSCPWGEPGVVLEKLSAALWMPGKVLDQLL